MKRFCQILQLIVVLTFCAIPISARDGAVTLSSVRNNEVILQFKTPDYSINPIAINGQRCSEIITSNGAARLEKGYPELPSFSRNVAIPANAEVDIEIISVTSHEISIDKVMPSKGSLTRDINPEEVPFEFGTLYTQNKFVPETSVELSEPFIFRDIRGVTVSFSPFQYNPVLGKLRVIESMTVKVKTVGISRTNVLDNPSTEISPSFDFLYKENFINYSQTRDRYPALADGDKMMVIVYKDFKDAMKPFVEWKNQKGIATTMYEFGTETGGSDTASLRKFIASKYESDKITYVLLVGDLKQVPSLIYTAGSEKVPTDPNYALIKGSDKYLDVALGRFSAETAEQVKVLVNKSVNYEKTPDKEGDWYAKAILTGTNEGTPKDYEFMRKYVPQLKTYGYTQMDSIYQGICGSTQDFIKWVNEGRGWINHMGHGSSSGFMFKSGFSFTSTNLSSLTNGSKLPVLYPLACNVGQFDKTCIAEEITRYEKGGAVLFFGSSPVMDWTQPQDANNEAVKLLVADTYLSFGLIFVNGESAMVEKLNTSATKTLLTWHMFGDPSLVMFTKKPKEFKVTCPSDIGTTSKDFEIKFDSKIKGRACLYGSTKGLIASALITDAESATLKLDASKLGDKELTLTVTGFNLVPIQKTIKSGITGIVNTKSLMTEKFMIVNCRNAFCTPLMLDSRVYKKFTVKILTLTGKCIYESNSLNPWNLRNTQGIAVSSGKYFATINAITESGIENSFNASIVVTK